ncbi:hypothetical protein CYMTET_25923, partial [Cymbomonas tetramitiformis]
MKTKGKKIHLPFVQQSRANAVAHDAVCKKCYNTRYGITGGKNWTHVREDPRCIKKDDTRWLTPGAQAIRNATTIVESTLGGQSADKANQDVAGSMPYPQVSANMENPSNIKRSSLGGASSQDDVHASGVLADNATPVELSLEDPMTTPSRCSYASVLSAPSVAKGSSITPACNLSPPAKFTEKITPTKFRKFFQPRKSKSTPTAIPAMHGELTSEEPVAAPNPSYAFVVSDKASVAAPNPSYAFVVGDKASAIPAMHGELTSEEPVAAPNPSYAFVVSDKAS